MAPTLFGCAPVGEWTLRFRHQFDVAFFQVARRLRRTSWASISAAVCLAAAGASILAADWLDRDTLAMRQQLRNVAAELRLPSRVLVAPESERLAGIAPSFEHQLDDVRDVFQLAERFDVHLNSAQYEQVEGGADTRFLTRRVTFRTSDEYQEIKILLQAVLENAPHAYLSSLTMEQGQPQQVAVEASFTIAWVYQAAPSTGRGILPVARPPLKTAASR